MRLNRAAQMALDKVAAFSPPDLRWHLLGHLQSNKAKKAAPAMSSGSPRRPAGWTARTRSRRGASSQSTRFIAVRT